VPELLPYHKRDTICELPYITVRAGWIRVSTVIMLVIYEERKKKGLVVRYMNNEV
jgi:hypothetical protein